VTAPPFGPAAAPQRPPLAELAALIRILALPGVGPVRIQEAVARYGGLEPAASALERQVLPGLPGAERLRIAGWVRTAAATVERAGVHVLVSGMASYPAPLRNLHFPPHALFALGRLELLRTPLVAVVGTRRCSGWGREAAGRIARGIAEAGGTVLSGLALGIDGAAHQAAGPARTVGIVGSGVDVVYPHQHRWLQREVARQGLLLSELLPGTPPAPFQFPRRNRLIAALARGVVVVEAPIRSGALITARLAADLGRPVLVVPGRSDAAASVGSNQLIRDGATMVTTAAEVLSALELHHLHCPGEDTTPPGLEGVGLALWGLLGDSARHVDELTGQLGLDPHQALASLLALEVQGHARQLPGFRFARA
jgi:DNA processing protein